MTVKKQDHLLFLTDLFNYELVNMLPLQLLEAATAA